MKQIKIITAVHSYQLEGLVNDFISDCPDKFIKLDFFTYWNGQELITGAVLLFSLKRKRNFYTRLLFWRAKSQPGG